MCVVEAQKFVAGAIAGHRLKLAPSDGFFITVGATSAWLTVGSLALHAPK
jgi:hypothetical protein